MSWVHIGCTSIELNDLATEGAHHKVLKRPRKSISTFIAYALLVPLMILGLSIMCILLVPTINAVDKDQSLSAAWLGFFYTVAIFICVLEQFLMVNFGITIHFLYFSQDSPLTRKQRVMKLLPICFVGLIAIGLYVLFILTALPPNLIPVSVYAWFGLLLMAEACVALILISWIFGYERCGFWSYACPYDPTSLDTPLNQGSDPV